jgi:hypothetical protein
VSFVIVVILLENIASSNSCHLSLEGCNLCCLVNFSLRREQCPAVFFNNIQIPASPSTKYLGIYLYNHLTWKEHIKKRKHIDLKIKRMYWLIGRNSKLSLENKMLLYKTIIKQIWTYGVEIWGCASKSNISIIQRSQSKNTTYDC